MFEKFIIETKETKMFKMNKKSYRVSSDKARLNRYDILEITSSTILDILREVIITRQTFTSFLQLHE